MKTVFVILMVACLSCMVPETWSAPTLFTNGADLGAAVGAFKGALDGAAAVDQNNSLFKNIGAIIKYIGSKAFSASSSSNSNNSFLQDLAKKALVQGATLGSGIALGAAVASKKHIVKHGPSIEHHEAPILLDSNPVYHGEHHIENAPIDTAVFHLQAPESYGELGAYREAAHTAFLHPQEYSEGIYR